MSAKDDPSAFRLVSRWPDAITSRRSIRGLIGFTRAGLLYRNPGLWQLLGGFQALLVIFGAFLIGLQVRSSPAVVIRDGSVRTVANFAAEVAVWVAVPVALGLLTRAGRAAVSSPWLSMILGQIVVALVTLGALCALPWERAWPEWLVLGLAVLSCLSLGGWLAGQVLGWWIVTSGSPTVQGWQMSAQAVEDRKGFLRLKIGADGYVTVYPIVFDRVCHDWSLQTVDWSSEPTINPQSDVLDPYLVEPPIRVGPR